MNDRNYLTWLERDLEAATAWSGETLPPSLFYCRLQDQPDHLVPVHLLPEPRDGNVILNPQCTFTENDVIHEDLASHVPFLEGFALRGPIAWVSDPVHGRTDPFWLDRKTHAALMQARLQDVSAAECLSPRVVRCLVSAGILLEAERERQQCKESAQLEKARARFCERGFAPVEGLLHPFHISALRRYYRHKIRIGALRFGDPQSSRRFVAHNESVARYFHHQLAPWVSACAGEPVKPSYVYVASYQAGADLEKHTDREQCEFSITFCLDFTPEPGSHTPWPLVLHTESGTISVYQRLGDGLLYRGTEIAHSRSALGAGKTSTSIFFHFVRDGFQGRLD